MDKFFLPGSVFDNINTFANSFGYENAGIVMKLALMPWESTEDRDTFILAATGNPAQSEQTHNFVSGKGEQVNPFSLLGSFLGTIAKVPRDIVSSIGYQVSKPAANAVNAVTNIGSAFPNQSNPLSQAAGTTLNAGLKAAHPVDTSAIPAVPLGLTGTPTGYQTEPFTNPPEMSVGVSPDAGKKLVEKAAKALVENKVWEVNPPTPSQDLFLRIAKYAEEKVISPFFRGVSTATLLTDIHSPLYQPGPYEKGFQLNDISRAWDRSEKVSAFQALTKSALLEDGPLGAIYNPLKIAFRAIGGPNIDQVNLFSNKSIQENYHDNIVGRYFTGIGDIALTIPVFGTAGKVIGIAGKIAGRASGVIAKDVIAQTANDMTDGLLYHASVGADGRATNIADLAVHLSKTTDRNTILNHLTGVGQRGGITTNDRLIDVIANQTNPQIIGDLILADKGWLPSIERLASNGYADDTAHIGNVGTLLRRMAADNHGTVALNPELVNKLKPVFTDSIKKDPAQQQIFDALMTNTSDGGIFPLFQGNMRYMSELKVGNTARTAIGNLRLKAMDKLSELQTHTLSGEPFIQETWLGGSRSLSTRVVSFFGSRMPTGLVTLSGTRPLDHITEAKAILDSLKLFRNGDNVLRTDVNTYVKAGDLYKQVISDVSSAITRGDKFTVHNKIDDLLGQTLLYTHGHLDAEANKAWVSELRARTRGAHSSIAEHGFGVDAQGALFTDPLLTTQLAQSYRYVDWAWGERQLIKGGKSNRFKRGIATTHDTGSALLDDILRFWSFDALARPQFIVKNSWLEPLLTATLGLGPKFIASHLMGGVENGLKNTGYRLASTYYGIVDKGERGAVSKALVAKSQEAQTLVAVHDSLKKVYSDLLKNASPKTIEDHAPAIRKQLKEAEKMVEKVEMSFLDATKQYGKKQTLPTAGNLQRRLDYLRTADDSFVRKTVAENQELIEKAQQAIYSAEGAIDVLLPNGRKIFDANQAVENNYGAIEKVLEELGQKHLDQANVFGRSLKFKNRYYGKTSHWRVVGTGENKQYVELPSIYGPQAPGAALRDEVSNASTADITYAQELLANIPQGVLLRNGPRMTTRTTDPLYFEELAWVANRSIRRDPLAKQILNQDSIKSMMGWAKTDEGKAYFRQFTGLTTAMIPSRIRNLTAMLDRYLPSAESQKFVLDKEVKSVELQKLLGKDIGKLSPIHPLDFDYQELTAIAARGGLRQAEEHGIAFMSNVFRALNKPENPIRQAYFDSKSQDIIAGKATALMNQGVKMTDETYNILAQSAKREALIDTEKTFYTQRRPLRSLWVSRPVTAFPTATMNAFYRYGRLAVNHPVRMAGFLHYYDGAFRSFGVDRFGNPVNQDNVLDAQYIVVPGTNDMGLFGGAGARLNARSLGFLLNTPSPTPISSIPVSSVMKKYPKAEPALKEILGNQMYSSIFPFGPDTSVGKAFTPTWLRDGFTWFQGESGKAAYANSVISIYNYHLVLAQMGLEKWPGIASIESEAKKAWRMKAGLEFISPAGVPIKVDTTPMAVFNELFYTLVNKQKSKGLSQRQASDAALDEYLSIMGANFPTDILTFKGRSDAPYVPSTIEGDKRFFHENKALIQRLQDLDPKLVSLIGADIVVSPADKNLSIDKMLKDPDVTLPTGLRLHGIKLTAEQIDAQRNDVRTWQEYKDYKTKLMSELIAESRGIDVSKVTPTDLIVNRNILATNDKATQALKDFANVTLKAKNLSWWESEYKPASNGDSAWKRARALYIISSDKDFSDKHGQTKFWQDTRKFLSLRETMATVYNTLPNGHPDKKKVLTGWLVYLENTISQWSPQLQDQITNYFSNDTLRLVE